MSLMGILGSVLPLKGQTITFSYTGAYQTYVVPVGVTCIYIDLLGAQGGTFGGAKVSGDYTYGGYGAEIAGYLKVTAGQNLYIFVGGKGVGPYGGFNGGGRGNNIEANTGTGGGGATDIRIGGIGLANRVVVAGGGGGVRFREVDRDPTTSPRVGTLVLRMEYWEMVIALE